MSLETARQLRAAINDTVARLHSLTPQHPLYKALTEHAMTLLSAEAALLLKEGGLEMEEAVGTVDDYDRADANTMRTLRELVGYAAGPENLSVTLSQNYDDRRFRVSISQSPWTCHGDTLAEAIEASSRRFKQ